MSTLFILPLEVTVGESELNVALKSSNALFGDKVDYFLSENCWVVFKLRFDLLRLLFFLCPLGVRLLCSAIPSFLRRSELS